jgi:hypothetical protein
VQDVFGVAKRRLSGVDLEESIEVPQGRVQLLAGRSIAMWPSVIA